MGTILNNIMRTSYSAIETYLQCPQKYKFQEIERIRVAKSREAIFGSAVHSALSFMFKKDPLFPTLDEVVANFRENWPAKEIFMRESKYDSLKRSWTEQEEKIYFAEGVKMIRRFYEKNAPWNFNVVDLESRFEVAVSDEKTGETHILAGIIDRIDRLPDGKYEIIDYKTGKRMPSQEALDKNLQLSLYSLGLQKRWPHLKTEDIKLSLYFLKHEEKLHSRITTETIQKTRKQILNTIGEIQEKVRQEKEFEPMPSALCEWCGFRPICPAWRHLYRKKTVESPTQAQIEGTIKEFFELKKLSKKNDGRMDELQKQIEEYMNQEKLTRVFGEDGVISKKNIQRYEYDWNKIKAVLADFGKWEEILKADEAKLKKIMGEIPEDARREIENSRKVSKEYTSITASLKRIKSPEDAEKEEIAEA